MHHKPTNMRSLSLLAVGGVCLLLTGNAEAQRVGARRALNSRSASTSSTTGSTTTGSTSANASTTSCPQGGSTSSAGTTTATTTGTTTTAVGATTTTNAATQVQTTSLASGTVSALRTTSNNLAVQWVGNTSNIKTVYVAVLNASRQAVTQKTITSNPVQASIALTSAAKYYGVQIVYKDGTSTSMTAPIR